MMCESRLRLSVFLGAVLLVVGPSVALADRAEAVNQLVSRGGLKKRDARKVIGKVAARMAKSADNFAPADDALRVAFSQKLFGRDTPPNRMKAAKVRLKLFAGPSAWALSALFGSGGGACQHEFGLSRKQCDALVVAGGGKVGAHASAKSNNASRSKRASAAPAATARRAGAKKSRFARYDSGFRGSSNKRPASVRAAKSSRFSSRAANSTASKPSRFGAKRPAQKSAVTAAQTSSTKAAYQARRKAYMERQKARLEARRSKLASRSRNAKVSRGVLPSQTAAAAASTDGDTMEFTADEAAGAKSAKTAAAPAAEPAQQQLSGDFLDGLLSDPLGGE